MKINLDLIDGFNEMTPEQQIEALKNFEYDDNSAELENLRDESKKNKELISKYSSQISELKKQATKDLTDNEKKALEDQEKFLELEKKYNELLTENKTQSFTTRYMEQGYDSELATEKAKAMVAGDMDKVFECEVKFNTNLEKKIKADVIKGTPHPDDKGDGKKTTTKEDLAKMSPMERFNFSKEHPDEYKKLYGGN